MRDLVNQMQAVLKGPAATEGTFNDRCAAAFQQLGIGKPVTREQVWRVLVLLGVVKVEIAFSGGNDEGGPDNVSVYFADEDILELYEPDTGSTSPEAKLLERLIEPLYDRWGGFDGNFEVTGLYTWDVATQTVDADFSETEWVGHTESW